VVALVPGARFRIILCIVALVGGQGASDIDGFLEFAILVTAHIALSVPVSISSRFDIVFLLLMREIAADR
jgi:hypothetical protein